MGRSRSSLWRLASFMHRLVVELYSFGSCIGVSSCLGLFVLWPQLVMLHVSDLCGTLCKTCGWLLYL